MVNLLGQDDEAVIDLRSEGEPEFRINRSEKEPVKAAPVSETEEAALKPHDKVLLQNPGLRFI